MYIGVHVKYLLFLSDFDETRIFSTYFRSIPKYQISWEIRPEGAELFHSDGQTDRQSLFATLRTRLTRRVELINLLAPEFYI